MALTTIWTGSENYLCDPELAQAFHIARSLGMPLLIEGEPGTGKTQLAYHIAHYFGLGSPLVFTAQTSSTAMDLFYKYDALGHFQYNQNNKDPLSIGALEDRFIRYNALGEAIRTQKRAVAARRRTVSRCTARSNAYGGS